MTPAGQGGEVAVCCSGIMHSPVAIGARFDSIANDMGLIPFKVGGASCMGLPYFGRSGWGTGLRGFRAKEGYVTFCSEWIAVNPNRIHRGRNLNIGLLREVVGTYDAGTLARAN